MICSRAFVLSPFLFFCITLHQQPLPAQTPAENIVRLTHQRESFPGDSLGKRATVEAWCLISEEYSHINLDSMWATASTALRLSKRCEYTVGQAWAQLLLAKAELHTGRMTKAKDGFEAALVLYKQAGNPSGQGHCHINLGRIYQDLGSYEEARKNYMRSIAIFSVTKENVSLANAGYYLGELVSLKLGNPMEGLFHINQAISLAEKSGEEYNPHLILYYLGAAKMGALIGQDVALGYVLKALQLARKLEDKQGIAQSYIQIAVIYTAKQEYLKAEQYLFEAETLFEASEDKRQLSEVRLEQATLFMQRKRYEEAIEVYKKITVSMRRMENLTMFSAAYHGLSNAYLFTGDTEKSAKYEKMFKDMQIEIDAAQLMAPPK